MRRSIGPVPDPSRFPPPESRRSCLPFAGNTRRKRREASKAKTVTRPKKRESNLPMFGLPLQEPLSRLLRGVCAFDVIAPQAVGIADVQPAVGDHRVGPSLFPTVDALLRRVRGREPSMFPVGLWRALDQGDVTALPM